MNKYKAFIFDLTGTLVDFGGQAYTTAIYRAFRKNNINISENIVKLHNNIYIGTRIKNICKKFNCMDKMKLVYDDINNELIKLNNDKYYTTPLMGALDTINYLKKNNKKIGIISNYYNAGLKNMDYDVFIKYNKITPWISFNILDKLNVNPNECLKIGEPYINIHGGFSLQMDTINVIDSSIEMNYDEETFDDLLEDIKNEKRNNIIRKYNDKYIYSINDINLFIKNFNI